MTIIEVGASETVDEAVARVEREGLTDRQRMSKVLAAEYQREQGEGYGPGREE